jgi:hypothetical protein
MVSQITTETNSSFDLLKDQNHKNKITTQHW